MFLIEGTDAVLLKRSIENNSLYDFFFGGGEEANRVYYRGFENKE